MNKATKIASTVAAVAIAAGTAVVYNDIQEKDKFYEENPELIPMDLPQLNLPTLDLPTIKLPDIAIPDIEIPEINTAVVIDEEIVESLNLPQAETYNEARFEQWKELAKDKRSLFKDRRNIISDSTATIDSIEFKKWVAIHKEKQNYVLAKVELEQGIRMIAEVTVPKSKEEYEVLLSNLAYYNKRGYNAALLTFDTSEELSDLVKLALLLNRKNMACWIAYSGPEDLKHSVYVDPDKLAEYISELAGISDGILVGWRRTALHLFMQDKPFTDFILKAARNANPSIMVLGEAYLGPTYELDVEQPIKASFNIPANSSGTIINNIGFQNVNVRGALTGVFKKVANMDRVAVVVGSRPYHMTVNKSPFSKEQQDKIKEKIESNFIKAGCSGTITLHGDGGEIVKDGVKRLTDSLCLNN